PAATSLRPTPTPVTRAGSQACAGGSEAATGGGAPAPSARVLAAEPVELAHQVHGLAVGGVHGVQLPGIAAAPVGVEGEAEQVEAVAQLVQQQILLRCVAHAGTSGDLEPGDAGAVAVTEAQSTTRAR